MSKAFFGYIGLNDVVVPFAPNSENPYVIEITDGKATLHDRSGELIEIP